MGDYAWTGRVEVEEVRGEVWDVRGGAAGAWGDGLPGESWWVWD